VPSHVILAPQISASPATIYSGQAINLTVQDLRTGNHIIQILKAGKAATLFSPNQPLTNMLSQSLTSYYAQQGLNTSGGTISIDITINRALVSVVQELMKYQANTDIQVSVSVTKGDKTLTNTINSRGASNGPLQADIAVLERDLNQQLGKVISDIISNADIIAFIKS
jgi:uncharacterized lipoprotein